MNTKKIILPLLVVLISLLPLVAFAQADPGGDPDGVPIDGGISVLVGAAVVYGVKALRKKGNKQAEENDK
jgi:hypothetical protein